MTDKLTTCLYFDGQAEEAARFYASIFPNSGIGDISRYGEGGFMPAGTVMVVGFTVDGRAFQAINGPRFERTDAVSLSIDCADQDEVDHYWSLLTADGGKESKCGWLKDKYGFSWQVVPRALVDIQRRGGAGAERAFKALFGMTKLNVARLEAAYAEAA